MNTPSPRLILRLSQFLVFAGCAVLLVGCMDEKEMIRKFAPPEDDELARRFVDLIRQGQYDEASSMVDPTVAEKAGTAGFRDLHRIVDHGAPIATELIGAHTGFFKPWDGSASSRQTTLTYQFQFADAWAVATVVVRNDDKGRHILGANFQPIEKSLQEINRFTFENKSALHYVFFAAAILVPLFILTVAVICFRSRVRLRWLWILFILIGISQVRLDWSSGQWDVQTFSMNLLGASVMRASSYAPLILAISFPLGAVLFLLLRSRLPRKDRPSSGPPPLPNLQAPT